jgi:cytoskeletal protein CcmA (bactofilin family)
MAVFNKKQKPDAAPVIDTIIGKDMLIKGEIQAGIKSLRVEGTVDGTIHSDGEVVVAPGGLVTGTILAKHLIVTGKVKGTVKTLECLEIHGTGVVEGEVEVGSLVVDEGGTLQGNCTHREPAAKEPKDHKDSKSGKSPAEVAKGGSLPEKAKV